MQFKIFSKTKLIMIILSGIAFILMLFLFFSQYNLNVITYNQVEGSSLSFDTNHTVFSEQINYSLPLHLKIPKININANFEYVGLTSDGAMDVPKGPAEVGWFKLGSRPGEIGNAVVAGHSGWKNNIPAVFDNLYKLQKGDKIYVEDDKGNTIVFVVRESRKYSSNENAPEVFVSNDGKSHLNLITCTGIWNIFSKSRSNRLVVFADKEI